MFGQLWAANELMKQSTRDTDMRRLNNYPYLAGSSGEAKPSESDLIFDFETRVSVDNKIVDLPVIFHSRSNLW